MENYKMMSGDLGPLNSLVQLTFENKVHLTITYQKIDDLKLR